MNDKTYVFSTYHLDGKRIESLERASSMRQAVARFRRRKEARGLSCTVRVNGSHVTYPVTRERWEHAWDGKG